MTSFLAFLHHLAAFTFVAALAIELVVMRSELDARAARKLQFVDLAAGVSAGVVLVVGLLRVVYFEKGLSYYLHSAPFIAKMSLFVIVALLSIYPTVVVLSWGKALKQGQAPAVTDSKIRTIRLLIHGELAGVVLIVLCAALMAKGVGYFG